MSEVSQERGDFREARASISCVKTECVGSEAGEREVEKGELPTSAAPLRSEGRQRKDFAGFGRSCVVATRYNVRRRSEQR